MIEDTKAGYSSDQVDSWRCIYHREAGFQRAYISCMILLYDVSSNQIITITTFGEVCSKIFFGLSSEVFFWIYSAYIIFYN